jgi:hypothetical protein
MPTPRLLAPFRPAWAAIVIVIGGVAVVAGYLLTARDVATLGLAVPIWQGIFFLLILTMFGVMFYHHAKPADIVPAPPAPLLAPAKMSAVRPGPAEQESIHRMRVFWRQYGHHAAHAMLDLYEEVTRKLANELWWGGLLRGSVGGYQEATDLMLKAVDGSPDITLTEVIDRFNRFYQAYVIHAAWLNRLDQHNVVKLAAEPHRESNQRWRAVHTAFRRELKSLREWPEYQGRLKTDLPFDPETSRFLDDEQSFG